MGKEDRILINQNYLYKEVIIRKNSRLSSTKNLIKCDEWFEKLPHQTMRWVFRLSYL